MPCVCVCVFVCLSVGRSVCSLPIFTFCKFIPQEMRRDRQGKVYGDLPLHRRAQKNAGRMSAAATDEAYVGGPATLARADKVSRSVLHLKRTPELRPASK